MQSIRKIATVSLTVLVVLLVIAIMFMVIVFAIGVVLLLFGVFAQILLWDPGLMDLGWFVIKGTFGLLQAMFNLLVSVF